LLYGMGRNDALPKRFFGAINPKSRIPANNIMAVGAFALAGAILLELLKNFTGGGAYEIGAEALNFGAFIAFMGVNAASFVRYFVRSGERTVASLLVPVLGFLICGFIWWNLSPTAKVVGTIWLGAGIAYGAWKTRGFKQSVEFESSE